MLPGSAGILTAELTGENPAETSGFRNLVESGKQERTPEIFRKNNFSGTIKYPKNQSDTIFCSAVRSESGKTYRFRIAAISGSAADTG